ncbi:hypothetical protein [Candidatus Terasakiella magnetica]|nr:hypothetical protein [Candidatus Terasakiella magnetica]
MIDIIFSFSLFIIAFLSRLYLRYKIQPGFLKLDFPMRGYPGDVLVHLVMIKLIRENNNAIPRQAPQFLVGGDFNYPAFYHWLCSFLPTRLLERYEFLISPLLEGIHAVVFYFGLSMVLQEVAILPSEDMSTAAAIGSVAFIFTPLLYSEPWHACLISPRVLGMLFGNIALFAQVVVLSSGAGFEWWACIAVTMTALVIITSKFSTQAVVFISSLLSLLSMSYWPILLTFLGILLSIICTGGYAWLLIKGHINHSRHYCYSQSWTSNTAFSSSIFIDSAKLLIKGQIRSAIHTLKKHPAHRILMNFPWILVFFILLFGFQIIVIDQWHQKFLLWAFSGILVAFIVISDRLKFIGESYRYFDYCIFPFIITIFSYDILLAYLVFAVTILYSVISYIKISNIYINYVKSDEAYQELLGHMQRLSESTILCLPGRLVYPLLYEAQHKAVWWLVHAPKFGGAQFNWWAEWQKENETVLPFVSLKATVRSYNSYGAELLVFDSSCDGNSPELESVLKRIKPSFDNGRYQVYEIKNIVDEQV